jgi:plasmid stability protein
MYKAHLRRRFMAEVRVRKIEDWVVAAFRARAKRHKRSLEAELRDFLRQEALRPRQEFAQESRAVLNELHKKYGTFSDSTKIIRDDRNARG